MGNALRQVMMHVTGHSVSRGACHVSKKSGRAKTFKRRSKLNGARHKCEIHTTGHMSRCLTINIWYARQQGVRNAHARGEKHVLRMHPPIPENLDLGPRHTNFGTLTLLDERFKVLC